MLDTLPLLDDSATQALSSLWEILNRLPEDFRDIPINTQGHHGIDNILRIGELPSANCNNTTTNTDATNFLTLAQQFITQLPFTQKQYSEDLTLNFLAETEMIAYCDCCGVRIHYQLDISKNRFDIAAHQQHQFAESGRDASCQYHRSGPLVISISTPSQAIIIGRDMRLLVDENLPRMITSHINRKMMRVAGTVPSKAEYREITRFLQSLRIGYFNTASDKHYVGVTDGQLMITANQLEDLEFIGTVNSSNGICVLDYNHFSKLAMAHYGNVEAGIEAAQGVIIETGRNAITLKAESGSDGQIIEISGSINYELIDKRVRAEHR